jgi:hypothetical protein
MISRAAEDILSGDSTRVTYPGLIKALNAARSLRFDKESNARMERERNDHAMFWDKRSSMVHEPCLDRRCGSCPGDKFTYCEDIAQRTMALIKEKFSMEDCQWSISERLAKEFPGAGFEIKRERHQWAKIVDGKPVSCDAQGRTGQERKPYIVRKNYQQLLEEGDHHAAPIQGDFIKERLPGDDTEEEARP